MGPTERIKGQENEVELLARMEHSRWNAERFLAGWIPGPKCVSKKTSPYLVPWEELPEKTKHYDRGTVRDIPQLLELVGEKVFRRGGTGAADS
ncbi:MAG: RyR domain-containing protein [Candidatus Hydrogenedentes bacterium]|nr:RyR domain-containing protein [Candidatus Hydrogenedentota bacterium]